MAANLPSYAKIRKPWTYVLDWLVVFAFVAGFLVLNRIDGYHQLFSLDDKSIQYTFATAERVPVWALMMLAVVAPVVIITAWVLLIPVVERKRMHGRTSWHEKFWEVNLCLLGLGLAYAATLVVTNVLKITVGRPRPDLIERCQPVSESTDAPVYGLSTDVICTRQDLLKEGFRSFPSGHSSTSFAGLGYLALFLAGRLTVLDQRGEIYKIVIVAAPLVGAALIAATRIMDNRHHVFDVIFGSILGMLLAWMAYRQFFPAVATIRARGRPYALMAGQQDDTGYDEEHVALHQNSVQPEIQEV